MTAQVSTARQGAVVQGPPPDVEALLTAGRRLREHADLLETRQRQVRLEMERVPWTSPAAQAAKDYVEAEVATVAQQVRELRFTAGKLTAYAQLVAERMATAQRAAAALTESLGSTPAPAAGAAA